jgi:hypothetical protein
MEVQVNYLAILAAAVSSMIVGAVWYAKSVFGKEWMKLARVDEDKAKDWSVFALVVAFVSSLVMAFVLAHVTFLSNYFFKGSYLEDALMTGLWAWIGFQGFRIFMHDAFEGRRKKLSIINMGNELATIMVMALIIGLVGI